MTDPTPDPAAREELAAVLFEDYQSRRYPTTPFPWSSAGIERDEFLKRADTILAAGYVKPTDPTDLEDRRVRAVEDTLEEYARQGWRYSTPLAEALVAAVVGVS